MTVVTKNVKTWMRANRWSESVKVSKEKAAENRGRILDEAARLFRERGAGVGVDALTQAAGLTHGSLYSQFGSKDRLMAEAIQYGYDKNAARADSVKRIEDAVASYLSPYHRENAGSGCFMAALGCDMPRQSADVRHTFTGIVRRNIARLAGLLQGGDEGQRENDATARIATMVGAMVLARAVDDPALSDRILAACRARLGAENAP
jgi:TetR/AcrR family transcriptional repressor of nem operon